MADMDIQSAPASERASRVVEVELPDAAKDMKLRSALLALGYDEAVSVSFISAAEVAQALSRGYLENVGTPGVLYFVMNCALLPFSMSTESQTNRPAYRASDASVKTYARIERQVCHQGAHASAKIGTCSVRARATALV